MTTQTDSKPVAKRVRKMAREPEGGSSSASQHASPMAPDSSAAPAPSAKPQSKAALVLDMLRRENGATLEQLVAATAWLPHTTRAALTGLKKQGHEVTSIKAGGVRTYRAIARQQADTITAADRKSKPDA